MEPESSHKPSKAAENLNRLEEVIDNLYLLYGERFTDEFEIINSNIHAEESWMPTAIILDELEQEIGTRGTVLYFRPKSGSTDFYVDVAIGQDPTLYRRPSWTPSSRDMDRSSLAEFLRVVRSEANLNSGPKPLFSLLVGRGVIDLSSSSPGAPTDGSTATSPSFTVDDPKGKGKAHTYPTIHLPQLPGSDPSLPRPLSALDRASLESLAGPSFAPIHGLRPLPHEYTLDDPNGKGKARAHCNEWLPLCLPSMGPPSNLGPLPNSNHALTEKFLSVASPSNPSFNNPQVSHSWDPHSWSQASSSGTSMTYQATPAASTASHSRCDPAEDNDRRGDLGRNSLAQLSVQFAERENRELQQMLQKEQKTNRLLRTELDRAKLRGAKLEERLTRQRVENEDLEERLLGLLNRALEAAKDLNLKGYVTVPEPDEASPEPNEDDGPST